MSSCKRETSTTTITTVTNNTETLVIVVRVVVVFGLSQIKRDYPQLCRVGTPSGVGTARKPPIYMKAGDTAVCTYEGLGTLTNPVIAEPVRRTTSR
jgi:acylpyruvate hydrolase